MRRGGAKKEEEKTTEMDLSSGTMNVMSALQLPPNLVTFHLPYVWWSDAIPTVTDIRLPTPLPVTLRQVYAQRSVATSEVRSIMHV